MALELNEQIKRFAKNIKIIFFDIDGTLLDESKTLPQSIPSVIKKLQQQGIITAIATGRSFYGIPDDIKNLKIDSFVTINGQYVEHHRNSILNLPLDATETSNFVNWCQQNNIAYGFTGKTHCAVSEKTDCVNETINPIYPNVLLDPDFHKKNDVYQIWAFTEQDLDKHFPNEQFPSFKLIRWHPHGFDVLPKSASKAKGIEAVLQALNLKKEEAMAFGDGLNDVEMFKLVGLPIAMGIAHPKLLPHAAFQTKKVEEDGIFFALKNIGLIE